MQWCSSEAYLSCIDQTRSGLACCIQREQCWQGTNGSCVMHQLAQGHHQQGGQACITHVNNLIQQFEVALAPYIMMHSNEGAGRGEQGGSIRMWKSQGNCLDYG